MPDLTWLYDLAATLVPAEAMRARFMQQALVELVLLAPMCAVMGVHVVNFRMAFFSDAISHSAFTGVALGLLLGADARLTMIGFALAVGLAIVAVSRKTLLSIDTVIGVFFSAVIAFGLAVVSRDRSVARNLQMFLYGDILTIGDAEIGLTAALFAVLMIFQTVGFNHLLYVGVNPSLASAHKVPTRTFQYLFAALLSLVVIVSVWAVGVFLVTAMLIVPAAAARNLARSASGMFWWALAGALASAVIGLIVSAQPWAHTATGATIVLVASAWFGVTAVVHRMGRALGRA
jgi:zinc transport system permease protein